MTGYGYNNVQYLNSVFNSKCYGKVNCTFPLNSTIIPTNCTSGYNSTNLVYFLQATCKSDSVNVLNLNKYYLSKEVIALVVVLIDAGLGLLLYFFLGIYLRSMQHMTMHEINESVLTASDFTVEIRNLPNHDDVSQLKFDIWEFIETKTSKSGGKFMQINPVTNVID